MNYYFIRGILLSRRKHKEIALHNAMFYVCKEFYYLFMDWQYITRRVSVLFLYIFPVIL